MKTAVSRFARASLFATTRRFFSGTFLSKISGLFREVALASVFGASAEMASFMVAFRLANFFRRFIGESGLAVAFIPHFEAIKAKSPRAAAHFFTKLSLSLKLLLAVLVGLISLSFYFGASQVSTSWQGIFSLISVLSLSLFFIGLYALNQAFLQTCGRFFVGSAAPVAFNITFVAGALIANQQTLWPPMYFLAVMALLGFAAQWIVTCPSVSYAHFGLLHQEDESALVAPSSKAIAKSTLLTLIGLAAVQINTALDSIFAKIADPLAPAYLWYAIRVYQLPLSLFAISFANALLPMLSKHADDETSFADGLGVVFDKLFLWMIPLTGALIVLAPTGLAILYGHGRFDIESLVQTTYCLWGYGLSLVANSAVILLAQAFYAKKEHKKPSIIAASAVVINIALNTLFVFALEMGAFGITLATAIATLFNAVALRYYLACGPFIDKKRFFKIFFATMLSAAVVMLWSVGKRDFSSRILLKMTAGLEMASIGVQIKAFIFKGTAFALIFGMLMRLSFRPKQL